MEIITTEQLEKHARELTDVTLIAHYTGLLQNHYIAEYQLRQAILKPETLVNVQRVRDETALRAKICKTELFRRLSTANENRKSLALLSGLINNNYAEAMASEIRDEEHY